MASDAVLPEALGSATTAAQDGAGGWEPVDSQSQGSPQLSSTRYASVVYIHGVAYDISGFDDHPGGKVWIESVAGRDATVHFEVHHLRIARARARLKRLPLARDQQQPHRPKVLPHSEDWEWSTDGSFYEGFYSALRRRAAAFLLERVGQQAGSEEEVAQVDKAIWRRATGSTSSMRVARVVAIALYCLTLLALCVTRHPAAAAACGVMTAVMGGFGHSAFHQRGRTWDCWLFELAGLSHTEWRMGNHTEHHVSPNLPSDPDSTSMLPFVEWGAPATVRERGILSAILSPLAFHVVAAFAVLAMQAQNLRCGGDVRHKSGLLVPTATLCLLLASGGLMSAWPELRYLAPEADAHWALELLRSLGLWFLLWTSGSLYFMLVTSVTHNQERNWTAESSDVSDWGAWQLATSTDIAIPCGLRGVPFCGMWLIFLHEQTLHHLFPAIDHSRLHALRPLVESTAREFGLELRPPESYCRLYAGIMATIAGVSASGVRRALASKLEAGAPKGAAAAGPAA